MQHFMKSIKSEEYLKKGVPQSVLDADVEIHRNIYINTNTHAYILISNATTCPYRLFGPSSYWLWPKCNRLLNLGEPIGRGYVAPMMWVRMICMSGVPGGALNLSSTSYPDHGRYGDLPLQGRISTAEQTIEPGTSWLVIRSSDHQTTRAVI
jgi:hypothetical protein